MIKNTQYVISIIAVALFIILLVFLIFKPQNQSQLIKKPSEDLVESDITWIIKFSVADQKATAYTEYSQAPAASSGEYYDLGSVAVHPASPLQFGGNALEPLIPFGTILYLNEPLQILGHTYDKLYVNDTGDVNYNRFGESPYWIDLFVGNTNTYNNQFALDWGVTQMDYYWFEEWK